MTSKIYAVLISCCIATFSYAESVKFEPKAYLKMNEGIEENDYVKTRNGINHCLGVMYLAAEAGFVEDPQNREGRFYKAIRGVIGLGVMLEIKNSGFEEDGKSDNEIQAKSMEAIAKIRQAGIDTAIAYDDQLDDVVVDGKVDFYHPFFGELEHCIKEGNIANVL